MPSVAILTPSFDSFDPAYSLSHVISDQTLCLARAGYSVDVFVSESFDGGDWFWDGRSEDGWLNGGVRLRCVLPRLDHEDSDKVRKNAAETLRTYLQGYDSVFTHDWISHPRMVPLYEGLLDYVSWEASPSTPWFHWVHSAPIGHAKRCNVAALMENHKVVYPLACDVGLVALQFGVPRDRIVVIPHIVDEYGLPTYGDDIPQISQNILDLIANTDIVQIYPAGADRLIWKGVDKLVKLFGALKAEGHSVCCIILDSWTGRLPRKNLSFYRQLMRQACLSDDEFIFASQIDPEFRGLPRGKVYRLLLASNVFAFPSMGEAFGLVLPEAILAGNLPICNASLPGAREVCGGHGLYAEFGSCQAPKPHLSHRFFSDLAQKIGDGLQKKVAIEAKAYIRGALNMEHVYEQHYAALLKES